MQVESQAQWIPEVTQSCLIINMVVSKRLHQGSKQSVPIKIDLRLEINTYKRWKWPIPKSYVLTGSLVYKSKRLIFLEQRNVNSSTNKPVTAWRKTIKEQHEGDIYRLNCTRIRGKNNLCKKKKSGWRIKLEHFIKTRRVCITPFLPSVLLNTKKDLT